MGGITETLHDIVASGVHNIQNKQITPIIKNYTLSCNQSHEDSQTFLSVVIPCNPVPLLNKTIS